MVRISAIYRKGPQFDPRPWEKSLIQYLNSLVMIKTSAHENNCKIVQMIIITNFAIDLKNTCMYSYGLLGPEQAEVW